MNRFGWISMLAGFVFGLLLWTAPPVQADCNPNIRATTPTSDFSLNDSNGTATHLKTGLIWMRCALGQSWNSTLKTCTGSKSTYTWGAALRAARGYSFAGHSDWRLPNAKELATIIEDRCYLPSINETVFPVTSVTLYWSSLADANNLDYAWGVNFYYGHVLSYLKGHYDLVRLVRGGQWFGDYVGGGGGSGASVTLEVLDGQAFRFGAGIATDPSVLGNLGKNNRMNGAAADGEARLVLRARTTQPGSITFSIPAGDGQLIHYQGTSSGSSVTMPTVPVGSEHMAFAIYRAPEQFPRAGHPEDESLARRDIPLKISGSDGITLITQMLVLERPPVVLVHGLLSSSDTWQTFAEKLKDRIDGIRVYYGDYRDNNTAHFSTNKLAPPAAVINARNAYRNRGIAAVQADVFGHSMGGILSRVWAGDSQYRKDKNYRAGDFNKLITVDSPHTGSPWANLGWLLWNNVNLRGIFEELLGTPTDVGALEDLRTGLDNPALVAMNNQSPDVPGHVIVGNYEPTVDDLADLACLANTAIKEPYIGAFCKAWKIFKFFGYNTSISLNFPVGSDLVVSAPSQRDGFGSSFAPVSEYSHIHMKFADRSSALDTDEVVNKAVELLNTAPDDSQFGHFGNGYSQTSAASDLTLSQRLAQLPIRMAAVGTGIHIISPVNGSTVAPGQTVTVMVQLDTGLALTALMLTGPSEVQQRTTAPWTFPVTIPQAAVGPFGIAVVGKDNVGAFYTAEVTLNVTPTAALRLLDATPATVELTEAGLQQSLVVQGTYQDDSVRDLTAAATGTTYQSSNTGVVTVDANGRLTAKSNGAATVTVANSGVSAYVTVRVEAESDLAISQTTSPNPIGADGLVTYTLTVQNQGAQRALNVQVSDTLPTGATLMQATGAGWVCNGSGGVVSCIRDTLNAGTAATVTLKVKATLPCDAITNQATVTASTPDSNANNNVSVATASCPRIYRITVTKRGVGIVTSQPPGIDCGATCSANFLRSAVVTLTASTFRGWQFARWTGCTLASSATCTVLRSTTNRTITATFNPVLTVFKFGEGTVTSDPAGIQCGTDCSEAYPLRGIVTLTAHAARGWTFQRWGGNCAGTASTCAVSMAAARYVTATFVRSRPGIFVD